MTPLILGLLLVVGGIVFAAAPFLRRGRTGDDRASAARAPLTSEPSSSPTIADRPAAAIPADPDLDAEAERLIADARAIVVSCSQCGPRPEPDARFCSRCGTAIAACPACGQVTRQVGARFCDGCGAAVATA